MTTLYEEITVERSVDDCFRYLLDFSTIEQWDPGVYRATKRTAGAPKKGSVFEVTLSSMGRKIPMRYEIEALEDRRRIQLFGRADELTSRDTIELKSLGPKRTKICFRAELTLRQLPAIASPVARPFLERIGKKTIDGLYRALTPQRRLDEPSITERLKYKTILPAARDFTERGYLKIENKGLSDFIDGQTAVITGPTSGLGLATAKLLARLGARLILVGRGQEKLTRARRDIRHFSGCTGDDINVVEADLSTIDQVRRAATEVASLVNAGGIDILINNAGALFDEHALTADGIERTMAINLMCPFVLTSSLIDELSRARGRVITVASGGMYTQGLRLEDMNFEKEPFHGPRAYARAKRGLVAITDHWSKVHGGRSISFNSMHPGWADTPGVSASLPRFYRTLKTSLRDARMGADTIVWLATSPAVDGVSGRFFFDRKPRPKAILPNTAVSPEQRLALVDWLRSQAARQSKSTVAQRTNP